MCLSLFQKYLLASHEEPQGRCFVEVYQNWFETNPYNKVDITLFQCMQLSYAIEFDIWVIITICMSPFQVRIDERMS